jgi:hypothetical protein
MRVLMDYSTELGEGLRARHRSGGRPGLEGGGCDNIRRRHKFAPNPSGWTHRPPIVWRLEKQAPPDGSRVERCRTQCMRRKTRSCARDSTRHNHGRSGQKRTRARANGRDTSRHRLRHHDLASRFPVSDLEVGRTVENPETRPPWTLSTTLFFEEGMESSLFTRVLCTQSAALSVYITCDTA